MTDFRLKVFCCVARHLSFTQASKVLLISQPAISKHIQELEAEYDTCLFDRKSSGITLTPAGELLLTHAKGILNNYRQLNFEMNLLSQHPGEKLRLGISTTIAQYILPDYWAQWQQRLHPVEISLLYGSPSTITRAVENDDVELGIIEGGVQEPDLLYTPFRLDESLCAIERFPRLPMPQNLMAEEFYFVQKSTAPKGIASTFMRHITRKC